MKSRYILRVALAFSLILVIAIVAYAGDSYRVSRVGDSDTIHLDGV